MAELNFVRGVLAFGMIQYQVCNFNAHMLRPDRTGSAHLTYSFGPGFSTTIDLEPGVFVGYLGVGQRNRTHFAMVFRTYLCATGLHLPVRGTSKVALVKLGSSAAGPRFLHHHGI